jgi:hypothetical protein
MTDDPEPAATTVQALSPYQQLSVDEEEEVPITTTINQIAARGTLRNFILMSVLFSANHGCVVGTLGYTHYSFLCFALFTHSC